MSWVGAGQARVAALAGLAIVANLVTASGYVLLHRDAGRPAVPRAAVAGAGAVPAPTPAAITAVLQRRSRAVLAHDRAAFLATVDPYVRAFHAEQETLFDDLTKVPLSDWHESLAATRPAMATDDGWTARLTLSYRLRGFDRADVHYTRYLTFDRRGALGWVASGDGTAHGLRDDPQIWDGGSITVVHGSHSLVIGEAGAGTATGAGAGGGAGDETRTAELRDIAKRLDRAVRTVSGVVGDHWARRVVALAPATEQQAEDLVGDVRNLGDIAALATVSGDAGHPGGGADRVVITPTAFARLNGLGRHVVLTHELVHVAMGGARDDRTPMWLIEGLADYVGYKGTGVSTRAAARELAGLVASGDVPGAPPARGDFGASGTHLSAAYEEAWLACRMIAERYGEARLVRLYRTAMAEPGDAGDPGIEERALHTVLGISTSEFDTRWRAYVHEQLT